MARKYHMKYRVQAVYDSVIERDTSSQVTKPYAIVDVEGVMLRTSGNTRQKRTVGVARRLALYINIRGGISRLTVFEVRQRLTVNDIVKDPDLIPGAIGSVRFFERYTGMRFLDKRRSLPSWSRVCEQCAELVRYYGAEERVWAKGAGFERLLLGRVFTHDIHDLERLGCAKFTGSRHDWIKEMMFYADFADRCFSSWDIYKEEEEVDDDDNDTSLDVLESAGETIISQLC
jgi:hypothetical protein